MIRVMVRGGLGVRVRGLVQVSGWVRVWLRLRIDTPECLWVTLVVPRPRMGLVHMT